HLRDHHADPCANAGCAQPEIVLQQQPRHVFVVLHAVDAGAPPDAHAEDESDDDDRHAKAFVGVLAREIILDSFLRCAPFFRKHGYSRPFMRMLATMRLRAATDQWSSGSGLTRMASARRRASARSILCRCA